MPSFKLTVAYDGTAFVGWQRQASGISIQGLLEDALAELEGRPVSVMGAGRTDAGVHATGQVAGVSLARDIDAVSLMRAVNVRLPDAVRVTGASEVPASFHARFHARSKTYRYRIWNAEAINPFERAYTWHIPAPVLDVAAMAAAARLIEGSHDFAAFQGAGTETHGTDRVVFSSRVFRSPGGFEDPAGMAPGTDASGAGHLITYEICGGGFLRYMVRNIAGTLAEIGRGKHPGDWVREVIASRERARAGPTAPAQGLFLVAVEYA
jgi:tRNA pseudouridine38-40 synthase